MIVLTLENIEKYLTGKGLPLQKLVESNQLCCMKNYGAAECPLFFRTTADDSLLQMLLFFPFSIKVGAESDLARFLHYINKKIDLPGFCIDDSSGVIFYRLVLPSYEKKLPKELVGIYLAALEEICSAFIDTIRLVAEGKQSYAIAVKELKNF